jgi:hypothetical protein
LEELGWGCLVGVLDWDVTLFLQKIEGRKKAGGKSK